MTTDVAAEHRNSSAETNPWLVAVAQSDPASDAAASPVDSGLPSVPPLFGAHGGAGASTWARLLGTTESPAIPFAGVTSGVVLVTRCTLAGIEAAKSILHDHAGSICAVLLVPASAGRRPRPLRHEVKVLRGAVSVVEVAWRSDFLLRRLSEISPELLTRREQQRLHTELSAPRPSTGLTEGQAS